MAATQTSFFFLSMSDLETTVNYQDQSTNHLVSKCQIILAGTLFNKAFSSLHVTQLDEKLDLEKMVVDVPENS